MSGIGILGGTFDPIHIGHLRSAWEVSESLSLDAMQFIPSAIPVHRTLPIASAQQRLEMVRLSLLTVPSWSVNDCEVRRAQPSYTIDTLLTLRQQQGEHVPFWLLVGSDAFEHFVHWHRWQDILHLTNIAVMVRAGIKPQGCVRTQQLLTRHNDPVDRDAVAGQIRMISVTALSISATSIREACGQGQLPRFLVTSPVLEYIQQQGLYKRFE